MKLSKESHIETDLMIMEKLYRHRCLSGVQINILALDKPKYHRTGYNRLAYLVEKEMVEPVRIIQRTATGGKRLYCKAYQLTRKGYKELLGKRLDEEGSPFLRPLPADRAIARLTVNDVAIRLLVNKIVRPESLYDSGRGKKLLSLSWSVPLHMLVKLDNRRYVGVYVMDEFTVIGHAVKVPVLVNESVGRIVTFCWLCTNEEAYNQARDYFTEHPPAHDFRILRLEQGIEVLRHLVAGTEQGYLAGVATELLQVAHPGCSLIANEREIGWVEETCICYVWDYTTGNTAIPGRISRHDPVNNKSVGLPAGVYILCNNRADSEYLYQVVGPKMGVRYIEIETGLITAGGTNGIEVLSWRREV